jgi:hypothetical protein
VRFPHPTEKRVGQRSCFTSAFAPLGCPSSYRRLPPAPMLAFLSLATRWFLRAVLLALFVIPSAGYAAAVPGLGEGGLALALGAADGVFWWCAVYGPPSWADSAGGKGRLAVA